MTAVASAKAHPHVLAANQPLDRFYRGGRAIAEFRSIDQVSEHSPEDWLGSVTAIHGTAVEGKTHLTSTTMLADAIEGDPVGWLGKAHVDTFGADPCLLVKLLDAGERLPIHVHPTVDFAVERLGASHGKSEAWIFLRGAPCGVGFARDVSREELDRWVQDQDVESMLGAMHTIDAKDGDVVFVPAGLPHAIGQGAFVVEVQEPTDFSILMEWEGFNINGPRDGHLGLGFDAALDAVDRRGLSADAVSQLTTASACTYGEVLVPARQFFNVDRVVRTGWLSAGYSVIVGVAGIAALTSERGEAFTVSRGTTLITPHASGTWRIQSDSDFELLRCRPPAA
jgi:mannose-6-phosphate isomerase